MNISKQMYQNIHFNKQNKSKMSIKIEGRAENDFHVKHIGSFL